MPHGYFDSVASKLLSDFKEQVISSPREERMTGFPEAAVVDAVRSTWQAAAATVYRNWLQYLMSKKADAAAISAMTPAVRA